MKEKIKYILIGLIFYSCQSNFQSDEINRFKEIVGKEDYEITMEMLKKMEYKISTYYKQETVNNNYIKYLENTVNDKTNLVFSEKDCLTLKSYEESAITDKYIKVKYDTIYLEDKNLVRVLGKDTIWTTPSGNEPQIEKEIDKLKKSGHTKVNRGKILEILQKIGNDDPMILSYIEIRKSLTDGIFIDTLNPKTTAKYLIKEKPDFKNKLAYKLIILSEFYLWQIKEYGC